jgi:methylamine--corrinoid protein Co-methyltransferase
MPNWGNKGRLLEVWARGETGPVCFNTEFDTQRFWPLLRDITAKYKIEYDPNHICPTDDSELDNLWNAGMEFFLECGILNVTTERLIMFDEQEVKQVLANLHSEMTLGENDDAITLKWRGFEDYDSGLNPVGVMGRILGPISEDLYEKIAWSYAQEPLIDFMHFQGVIPEINGTAVKPFSAFELASEQKRVAIVKDVCRRAGRPGLSDGASMPVTCQAEMAAHQGGWGASKGDVRHVYVMPHMRTDYDQQCRKYMYDQLGVKTWGILQSFIGGLPGGPKQAVVNGMADLIAYMMLYEPSICGLWASDALYFTNTSRYALFVDNFAGAALQRHVKYPALLGGGWQMTAGIGSEEFFWETACGAIGSTTLGFCVSGGTGHQSGGLDQACGLGARFAAEVGRAVGKARLTRKQANDLMCRIFPKYEEGIKARTIHTKGGDFREVYDLTTVKPKPEYLKIYEKVKAELRDMGLPID